DRPRRHALAAAAFADNAERLARPNVEARSIDGSGDALVGEEVGLEVADGQERLSVHHTPYGSAASRRPSPRKLNARITTMTGTAGGSSHGKIATVCRFSASCSRTPKGIPAARGPNPGNWAEGSRFTTAATAARF